MSNNSGDDSLKPSADSSGAGRARLQDVAALAGVSVKTTSRVLSGLRTSPGSATSVLAAAKFLRYRPNTIARELRSGAVSSGVGMIVSDLSNPFYSKMASAAERVLAKENLELFIASTNEDPEKEEGLGGEHDKVPLVRDVEVPVGPGVGRALQRCIGPCGQVGLTYLPKAVSWAE